MYESSAGAKAEPQKGDGTSKKGQHMNIRKSTAVIGGIAAAALIVPTGAVAAGMIDSDDIKRGAVTSKHVAKDSLKKKDIAPNFATERFVNKNDTKGLVGVEVDGTYMNLAEGDGTDVKTFSVNCAEGKVATGGGYSVDFPQHRANVNVVGSQPLADETAEAIPGDPEGSIISKGWEIHVVNDGPATSIRPWVVCSVPAP